MEPQAAGPPLRYRLHPHLLYRSASHTDNPSLVPKPWADCQLNEPLNLPFVHWPDDKESETTGNLVEVSPEMTLFFQSCFGEPLSNSARQGLRKTVGVPKVDATK